MQFNVFNYNSDAASNKNSCKTKCFLSLVKEVHFTFINAVLGWPIKAKIIHQCYFLPFILKQMSEYHWCAVFWFSSVLVLFSTIPWNANEKCDGLLGWQFQFQYTPNMKTWKSNNSVSSIYPINVSNITAKYLFVYTH